MVRRVENPPKLAFSAQEGHFPMSNDKDLGRAPGELSQADRDQIRKQSDEIGKRLEQAKSRRDDMAKPHGASQGAGLAMALRFATELVVGICVGGAIGWALDSVFGTKPWLMILFIFLGFGAGLRTVIRSAEKAQKGVPRGRDMPGRGDDDET